MSEALYWVWLTSTLKFYSASVKKVLCKFTPELAYRADRDALLQAGIDEKTADRLSDKSLDRAREIIADCEKKGIRTVCFGDPDYPMSLGRLRDIPYVLYVRGDISCIGGRRTAAFIGTRKMTGRGSERGTEVASELVASGTVLVSGIAAGIDTVAARVSLDNNAPTVAVLGVDIDKYYPAENERLIDRVAEHGAVISEYPPRTGARFFATRNRIIVGLSDSVYVIEADEKSGALIGAKEALKMKMPVYALGLDGDSFAGCRQLISLGANPIDGGKASDEEKKVPKKTEPKPKKTEEKKEEFSIPESITGAKRELLEKIISHDGPCPERELFGEPYSVAQVLCALTELELSGYITALPGCKYCLKVKK